MDFCCCPTLSDSDGIRVTGLRRGCREADGLTVVAIEIAGIVGLAERHPLGSGRGHLNGTNSGGISKRRNEDVARNNDGRDRVHW